ncbi:MAG: PIG-L deacetylase family protein, partial [Thermoguttaceae bacterium]
MSFAADKKVLIITSHQDDESFFCGGLLCNIAGRSEVHVICMSRAKQERDIVARNQFLLDACKMLGARGILTNFREARHVWSSADLFFRKRCEQIDAMKSFVKKQLEEIQPEIVITHNEAGEYGHCYHKVVHRVCRAVCDSARAGCRRADNSPFPEK